ncbi:hypothetical protein ESCO_000166 [Escovopsis weberi]|uniref:Guanine nucleotide-exchange factor SEC12 n=1 Tax=Escovopsis weberi TaxID=150374 RepID=A0A0M8N3P5_ESCWE|nr:hypothetical protein ESCO_000166 [Escovopsis weberi]
MASPFPRASIELDYPLYALSFDPQNASRLVVGGGGGATRTGNSAFASSLRGRLQTVLETDAPDTLRVAGELELSRDEDSVMSLAFGADQDDANSPFVFAGVNSSPDDVEKGTNYHLRCLSVEQSKARAAAGAKAPETVIAEVSRHSFFGKPDADTYQRLLRTAGRLGAAASGMGKESQLAVFDAAAPKPRLRGVIELPKDAEELDVVQVGKEEYLVAFCYKYELYLVRVGKENGDPELIFTMPDDHGERPAFRSIRFMTPNFLLAVSNLPKRSGAIIQGFRLPGPGHENARIAASVRVPGKISATSLAVANVHPATPAGNTQFIIAVAANDCSIHLYTVEHQALSAIQMLSKMYPLYTLKDVHNGDSITGVAFSTFIPPTTAPAPTHPQYIKLASITLQKGVAVHSIPLRRRVDAAGGTSKTPSARYVTAMRSKAPSNKPLVLTLSVMVLIMAILGQGILEMYGWSKPVVHVHKFLPGMYGSLRDPAHPPAYFASQEYLISRLAGTARPEGETLVIWESEQPVTAADGSVGGDIKLDVHIEEVHGPAKAWEELSEKQKQAWREKLRKAGAWTQNMGESVFRGLVFSELAGAVGRAVAG